MYTVGSKFSNQIEVSYNAVVVEIMQTWIDPDDGEIYYVIKCREAAEDHGNRMYNAWFYEDEIALVNEYRLDKYYELVED